MFFKCFPEGDPTNYLTYYKRGTVYLALGKAKFALLDLDKVLELQPDFIPARLQRGNILLKQARFDEAELDFRNIVSLSFISLCVNYCVLINIDHMWEFMLFFILFQLVIDNYNRDALDALEKLYATREEIQYIDQHVNAGNHLAAIQLITRILEICPWSSSLRERRAESHVILGDYMSAISDIRSTTKLLSDNTEGFFKLAVWLYRLGQVDEALK